MRSAWRIIREEPKKTKADKEPMPNSDPQKQIHTHAHKHIETIRFSCKPPTSDQTRFPFDPGMIIYYAHRFNFMVTEWTNSAHCADIWVRTQARWHIACIGMWLVSSRFSSILLFVFIDWKKNADNDIDQAIKKTIVNHKHRPSLCSRGCCRITESAPLIQMAQLCARIVVSIEEISLRHTAWRRDKNTEHQPTQLSPSGTRCTEYAQNVLYVAQKSVRFDYDEGGKMSQAPHSSSNSSCILVHRATWAA